jgi:hypothetical protein
LLGRRVRKWPVLPFDLQRLVTGEAMDVIGDYATQTLFSLAGPGLAVDQQRARSGEHAALAESEHGLRVVLTGPNLSLVGEMLE